MTYLVHGELQRFSPMMSIVTLRKFQGKSSPQILAPRSFASIWRSSWTKACWCEKWRSWILWILESNLYPKKDDWIWKNKIWKKKHENPRTWTWVEQQTSVIFEFQKLLVDWWDANHRYLGLVEQARCAPPASIIHRIKRWWSVKISIVVQKWKRKIDSFSRSSSKRKDVCFLFKPGKATSIVSLAHNPSMLHSSLSHGLQTVQRLWALTNISYPNALGSLLFGRFPTSSICLYYLSIYIYISNIHLIFWDIRELSSTV